MYLYKRHLIFKTIIVIFLAVFTEFSYYPTTGAKSHEKLMKGSASSTITDEAINGFLFRINENVRSKVMALQDEPVGRLPVPVLFEAETEDLRDSWGEARPGGRIHTGIDIIAPKGDPVVSPSEAVVTKKGYDASGGNFIVTANPGGEQFYFAHLDHAAENLSTGDVLKTGDLIGYIGNTGNASSTTPHLHFEIYYKGISQNPFPRLARKFSAEEKIAVIERILSSEKIAFGSNNGVVRFLQKFLINKNTGVHAEYLDRASATGYFGQLTKNALAEFQQAAGINPSSGYFGPVSKAAVLTALNLEIKQDLFF